MTTSYIQTRADDIVKHLRENGFDRGVGIERQALNLAEEVGEFIGAYRRYIGQARRSGTAEEMHAELADVVITAYVTAAEMGIDLDAWVSHEPLDCQVLALTERVGEFVKAYRRWSGTSRRVEADEAMFVALADVAATAYEVATTLEFDLDAAIRAKLDVVFSRGWREEAPR